MLPMYLSPKVKNVLPYAPKFVELVIATALCICVGSHSKTLPVKLTSFDVALINKNVTVTWTTSQEKNASHFTIERSADGVEFTDAGIFFTEGNFETARSYSFKDPKSTRAKGILYYRLKMVDLDGKYEYSKIKLIKLGDSRR
jgi:hypothetical protein